MRLNTKISTKKAFELGCKSTVFFLPEKFSAKEVDGLSKECGVDVSLFLKDAKFTGAKCSVAQLPIFGKKEISYVFFAGLGGQGEDKKFCLESLRRVLGTVVKNIQAKGFDSVALDLPQAKSFGVEVSYFIQQITTIVRMASYKFDTFITTIDKKEKAKIIDVTLCVATPDLKDAKAGHEDGSVIAQAVNRTRDWVDTPPSQLTPTILAHHAKVLAKEKGLKCTIFGEQEIKKMGMGGLAGISLGSAQDAQFVVLEYKTKKAKAQTIGFVGKGITFDSGGLSIKPANSMEEMKQDMSGAASVINTMAALADLQPDVNVIGFAAITENMPGCSALKPGDIVTFYNGKTAEVRNTDAEGRLVLADALSYAVKNYKLDAIIDVATLTGACIYAVGPFFSALLSDNDSLAGKVAQAGNHSGDFVWRLPFTQDFKEAVKSSVADIQNVGNPSIAAGTITAAWFLRHFTDEVPWVHLDIASTAFGVPNISYFGKGATGSSVRLLIDVAMHWKK